MVPGAAEVLSGMVVSAAALLVAAGAAKIHGAVRGTDGDSAIRRALGIWPGHWRLVEAAAGAAECATGAAVCAGIFPVLAGATMAGLGAVFTALLLNARRAAVPGGCGCLRWRHGEAGAVTWLVIARAGWILAAGLASVALPRPGLPFFARPWFYAGVAAGSIMLALLSAAPASYRGLCGWQRWLPVRGTLASLTRHPVFAAMAGPAGLFGQEFGYRRAGCAEEFWFRASPESQCRPGAVVFRVMRLPGGALAVHASVRDAMPPAARRRAWPGPLLPTAVAASGLEADSCRQTLPTNRYQAKG